MNQNITQIAISFDRILFGFMLALEHYKRLDKKCINMCQTSFNPIQAGEGGGGGWQNCAKTACSRLMKLSDF